MRVMLVMLGVLFAGVLCVLHSFSQKQLCTCLVRVSNLYVRVPRENEAKMRGSAVLAHVIPHFHYQHTAVVLSIYLLLKIVKM